MVGFRQKYASSVESFYLKHGHEYRNDHEIQVKELTRWACDILNPKHVLDLACGSGEVSLVIQSIGSYVKGVDPYCYEAFKNRTRQDALRLTFDQVIAGQLSAERFDAIFCSFALHLLPIWKLRNLLFKLKEYSGTLVVITPIKRPEINKDMGWMLQHQCEFERVKCRIYKNI